MRLSRTAVASLLLVSSSSAALADVAASGSATVAVSAPGLTPPREAPAPARRDEQWWMLGMVRASGHSGARLQVDVLGFGGLSLGLGGTLLAQDPNVMDVAVPRASGTAYVAYTARLLGPIGVRAQLGFGGAIVGHASTSSVMAGDSVASSTTITEGALFVSVPLGRRLGLVGGPVVEYAATPLPGTDGRTLSVFAGLQLR
ncbi:MAG: hypothetical protein K8W52_34585 [Deltaproteobacteria bacterium]|nr:hypothetical protein [Deltaproteobacteria bacterium]